MGGQISALHPKDPGFEYMAVTVRSPDTIGLIYASEQELNVTREVIQQTWPKGIQNEASQLGEAFMFKLKGNPFKGGILSNAQDLTNARLLICHLLYRLHNSGWKLICSSDLQRLTDLTTWFFVKSAHDFCSYVFGCISLSSSDTLQVVNIPLNLHETIKAAVEKTWSKGIQKHHVLGDTLTIKLKGNPWFQFDGNQGVQARIMLQRIILELQNRQWLLHTSSNVRNPADTLFFRYEPSIVTGQNIPEGFIISLDTKDKIRVISASPDVTQCVKDTVVSSWNPGIQDEKEKFGCWSFKLRGTPWYTEGTVGVNARMLMTKILEALLARGWIVQTGIHTKRKTTDKCVLMFQRSSIPPCQILCLSMCSADKLRLIGAPQNVVDVFRDIVTNKWCFGASRETTYDDKGYGYELKLNENPWKFGVIGHDGAHARTLLMFLLRAFAQLGWRILLSADVSARYDTDDDDNEYPYDVHSWWFINDLANPQQNQQTQFGFGYQYGSSLLTGPPPSAPPPSYDTATKNW